MGGRPAGRAPGARRGQRLSGAARPGDLAATVEEVLKLTGLDPSWLMLELTEWSCWRTRSRSPTRSPPSVRSASSSCSTISATGHSSARLSQPASLPRNLKIDRQFVSRTGPGGPETAIVDAIIRIGRALSLQVLGEGIETEGQLAELERLGCELAQGYHFAAPLTARQMTAIINRGGALTRSTVR